MLTSAAKLSLNACLFMAQFEPERPLFRLSFISNKIDSPEAYTSKVLSVLVKFKILYSSRGPKGGFGLAKKSDQIRVIQIIEATDNLESIQRCFLHDRPCSSMTPCSMHSYFADARNTLYKALHNTRLSDIKEEAIFLNINKT